MLITCPKKKIDFTPHPFPFAPDAHRKTADGKLEDDNTATNAALVKETEDRETADGVQDANIQDNADNVNKLNESTAQGLEKLAEDVEKDLGQLAQNA